MPPAELLPIDPTFTETFPAYREPLVEALPRSIRFPCPRRAIGSILERLLQLGWRQE